MDPFEERELSSWSKLLARGDGPFQVWERINGNYKIDLPSDYNVSCTFNVSDLATYDLGIENEGYLGRNEIQEEGDDHKDKRTITRSASKARAQAHKWSNLQVWKKKLEEKKNLLHVFNIKCEGWQKDQT